MTLKHLRQLLGCLVVLLYWMPALCHAQHSPTLTLDQPIELRLRKATLLLVLSTLSLEKNVAITSAGHATRERAQKYGVF